MSLHIRVVIVCYRSAPTIEACLRSVLSQLVLSTIIVVDNSPESDVEAIVEAFALQDSRLRYIPRPDNPGFAVACNLGARVGTHPDYVAFVNPDVILTQPLSEIVSVLANSDYAVLAGGLINGAGGPITNARRSVTVGREFAKALLGSRVYLTRVPASYIPVPVGQVDGALLVTSWVTYAAINGFDERFELYYEDVDFCRSVKSLGGCALLPYAFGIHTGGASSAQVKGTAYIAGRISRIRYLRKWARNRVVVNTILPALALIEFLTRTLASSPEGKPARKRACREQVREIMRAGTVRILNGSS